MMHYSQQERDGLSAPLCSIGPRLTCIDDVPNFQILPSVPRYLPYLPVSSGQSWPWGQDRGGQVLRAWKADRLVFSDSL